jgi:hypothetical protein
MKISIRVKLVIGLGGMLLTFLNATKIRGRQKAVSDRLGDMGNETRKLEMSSAQLENEVGRFKVDSISKT